jgi:hypothetical protein
MSGNFPPDFFAPDFFTPDYFGGEVDANAMSASIAGVSEVIATISVTQTVVEDDDSGYWARVVKERRKKKLKAQKPVPGVLAVRIVGRSRLVALGEAPRVCWPCNVYAGIVATSALRASIEGPDRIAEQDEQDLQDLTDILMLLAA